MKHSIFYFFSLAVAGKGISGGDRIFIELARNWSKKHKIKIYTGYEGQRLCKFQNLNAENISIESINNQNLKSNFFANYFYKIYKGIQLGLTLKIPNKTVLYSSSEFWMDSFPCVLLKLRYPKTRWIASWYQTAPNPLKGYSEEGDRDLKYIGPSFLYWLVQLPVKPLIKRYADNVIVNNEDEKKQFPEHTKRGDTIVLLGAVNLEKIENWKKTNKKSDKVYDAVFQGRFHPQKGVVELMDIWKKVTQKYPHSKLAMIGDGPLMPDVRSKITKLGLEENVKLFGYMFDGPKKYSIFNSSKIVVHPAFYDSGGMAAAEAMSFGIPAVGFRLKSFDSYYPEGMVKVNTGDINSFAAAIIQLLGDKNLQNKIGKEAEVTIYKNWSWEKRAEEIFEKIIH